MNLGPAIAVAGLLTLGTRGLHGQVTPTEPVLRTASNHPMQYYVSLPAGWSPDRSWPIVVTVEGGNKNWWENARRFASVRDEGRYPFIVVTPIVLSFGGNDLRHDTKYPYTTEVWDQIAQAGGPLRAPMCDFDVNGLESVLADVRRLYAGEEKYFITGWSAGSHLTWIIVFSSPERLRGAALTGSVYSGRCMTSEVVEERPFSNAPERVGLPVKVLDGSNDSLLDLLARRRNLAISTAREHGFANVSHEMVSGVGHDPMPAQVLRFFASIPR